MIASQKAIHMPYINIHRGGHYHLEIVFVHARLPPISMGNTLYGV